MSSKEEILVPLLSALKDLTDWFKKDHVRGIVIGGVAASFLGRPRVTRDIDAVVMLDNDLWNEFFSRSKEYGFHPRIEEALTFAQKNRVLLLNHQPSGIDIDVSFGALPFEDESVNRSIQVRIGSISIPLPTPEDLIVMKAIAHRPVDMADIQGILDAHPDLNLQRIRQWVREFADVLEMPEILTDLEKMLSRYR